ncbi:MAG: hypothetical protein AAFW84_31245 [Cyanobacteria bacterium J06635_15]
MAKLLWGKVEQPSAASRSSGRFFDYLRRPPRGQLQAKVWVRSRRERRAPWLRFLWGMGFWSSLLTGSVLSVGVVWLGFESLIMPQSSRLLVWFLPHAPGDLGQDQPQTLADIETELEAAGFSLGSIQSLQSQHHSTEDWLVPVLVERQPCRRQCQAISELRLYRQVSHDPARYRLRDRIAVSGPPEAFVLAPLVGTLLETSGVHRPLPLVDVSQLPNGQDDHLWLTLQGTWSRNNQRIRYGQLLRYDPKHARLALLTDWTSPADRLPQWRQLDGVALPELLVDQRVGLEPNFLAYRINPQTAAFSLRPLQPISLLDPVFDKKDKVAGYEKALLLARSGLWSSALQSLEQIKQSDDQKWPSEAEAQLAFIRLHARVTQAQANQIWGSGAQQILAYLVDGRWQAALKLMEDAPQVQQPMLDLLAADPGQLWQRISTVLQVNPRQQAPQVWGLLLLTAQQDRPAALAWLARQSDTEAAEQQYQAIMENQDQPIAAIATPTATPVSQAESTAIASVRLGSLIGAPSPIADIVASRWYRPSELATMPPEVPQWFQIPISTLQVEGTWQRGSAPTSNLSPAQLWQALGLNQNRGLQLFTLSPEGLLSADRLTIQGLQRQDGNLWLLASGFPAMANQGSLLAASPNTLNQLTVSRQLSIPQLSQTQPEPANQIANQLQQRLGLLPEVLLAVTEDPAVTTPAPSPELPMAFLDVTGDGVFETIVNVNAASLSTWGDEITGQLSQPSTMIISSRGGVLFSDLQAPYQLVAVTQSEGNGAIALIVYTQGSYQLWQWSAASQRFQPL